MMMYEGFHVTLGELDATTTSNFSGTAHERVQSVGGSVVSTGRWL